jgi:UrcA family protein
MKTILLSLAAAVAATAASAQSPVVVTADTQPTIHVSYADLNLASTPGRQHLHERVLAAAHQLCTEDSLESLAMEMAQQHCYEASIHDADEQIAQAVAASSAQFASAAGEIRIVRR